MRRTAISPTNKVPIRIYEIKPLYKDHAKSDIKNVVNSDMPRLKTKKPHHTTVTMRQYRTMPGYPGVSGRLRSWRVAKRRIMDGGRTSVREKVANNETLTKTGYSLRQIPLFEATATATMMHAPPVSTSFPTDKRPEAFLSPVRERKFKMTTVSMHRETMRG
jgi:hypothetical protein